MLARGIARYARMATGVSIATNHVASTVRITLAIKPMHIANVKQAIMVTHVNTIAALDVGQLNVTRTMEIAPYVETDITVHVVAADVDRTVSNVQTMIPVTDVNLDIGVYSVGRDVAVVA